MTAAYPIHPAANLMPRLGDAGIAALAADIKANGLHEPVVLFDGQVLDGRHRLAACELAGVEPTYRTLTTCPDPVAFVLSINVRRRHLSTSQLAMVAGRVAVSSVPNLVRDGERSVDAAARMVGGVEKSSVILAVATLKNGIPELAALVDGDELAVSVAAKAARFSRERQAELVAQGPEAIREAVKAEVKPREPKSVPASPATGTATTAPTFVPSPATAPTSAPEPQPRIVSAAVPHHPLLDELDSAADRDALDRVYNKVAVANLSSEDAEAAGEVYRRRLNELRAKAPAPVEIPAPPPAPPSEPAPKSAPKQADLFAGDSVPVSTQAPVSQPPQTVASDEVAALRAEVAALHQWIDATAARAGRADEAAVKKAMHLIALASSPNENEARNAAYRACAIIRERGLAVASTITASRQTESVSDEELEAMRRANRKAWDNLERRVENMGRSPRAGA